MEYLCEECGKTYDTNDSPCVENPIDPDGVICPFCYADGYAPSAIESEILIDE